MPHINYFTKELEILNKRIFFSREHNIMFLTTPKCGSQFTKLFCLLNLIDDLSKSAFQQPLFIDQEQHSSNNKNVVEDYFRKWANNNPVNMDDLNNSSIKKYQIVRDPYKRLISFLSSNLNKLGDSDDSAYVGLRSHATVSPASYTLTLPAATGSSDQYLKTDGSGNLSWVDPSSGGISMGKAIAAAIVFG